MKRAGHELGMSKKKNTYSILVGKT